MHPIVYPGDFDSLLREWNEKAKEAWKENGQAGLDALKIANGECARLAQELTSVGWTGRWRPGERVVDVAKTLKPGTVIANFLFEYGKAWYPSSHGWHAALFVRGEGYSVTTGKPSQIIMFDQWRGKRPSERRVRDWPDDIAKIKTPSNTASEFFVVLVP